MVTEAVRRALEGPDDAAYGRLRAHVLAVADATASDACLRGCLLAKGTAGPAAQDPAVAARARQAFEALEELIVSCVAAAQQAGDIKPDADPARLAGLLLAVLRGIEAPGKGGSGPASSRAIAETALAVLPMPRGGQARSREPPVLREMPAGAGQPIAGRPPAHRGSPALIFAPGLP
jgi:hypothetical protein